MESLEDVINSYCARDRSLSNGSKTHVASAWCSFLWWWPTWGATLDTLCCETVMMQCLQHRETQRTCVFVIAYQKQMKHIVSSLHRQTQHYEDIYHFIKVFVLSKKKACLESTDMESKKARPGLTRVCFCSYQRSVNILLISFCQQSECKENVISNRWHIFIFLLSMSDTVYIFTPGRHAFALINFLSCQRNLRLRCDTVNHRWDLFVCFRCV